MGQQREERLVLDLLEPAQPGGEPGSRNHSVRHRVVVSAESWASRP